MIAQKVKRAMRAPFKTRTDKKKKTPPNKRAADEDDDEKANERKGTEKSHILKN